MNALYWPSFINYQLLLPYTFRLGHILAMDALQSKKYDSISLFMVAVIPLLFCCSTIYLTISNQFLISLPIGLFGGDKNKSMYQTIVYMVAICQLIQMVFFGFVEYSIFFSIKNTLASGTRSFHGSYHLRQLPVWPHTTNIFRVCDAVSILHIARTHYPTVLVSSDYVLGKSADNSLVERWNRLSHSLLVPEF